MFTGLFKSAGLKDRSNSSELLLGIASQSQSSLRNMFYLFLLLFLMGISPQIASSKVLFAPSNSTNHVLDEGASSLVYNSDTLTTLNEDINNSGGRWFQITVVPHGSTISSSIPEASRTFMMAPIQDTVTTHHFENMKFGTGDSLEIVGDGSLHNRKVLLYTAMDMISKVTLGRDLPLDEDGHVDALNIVISYEVGGKLDLLGNDILYHRYYNIPNDLYSIGTDVALHPLLEALGIHSVPLIGLIASTPDLIVAGIEMATTPNNDTLTINTLYIPPRETSPPTYGGDNSGNPSLTNDLAFVSDITVKEEPTLTSIKVGQTFTKTWRLKNSGSTTWNSNYHWAWVGAEQMGGPSYISAGNVSPGSMWDASVQLTVPMTPGIHTGYWQMEDSNGNYFGDKCWVRFFAVGDINDLDFVSDVTIPDGTHISAGQPFTKTWRLKNTGNTTWNSDYHWTWVDGEQMGGTSYISAGNVSPGSTWDASVQLTSSMTPGIHVGYWQMEDPNGNTFGDKCWVAYEVTFTAHIQTTADGSAYNAKARLQKQSGGDWQTVQDWKATPYDVSDLTKGVYRVQYSDENVPAWYQIPADETFNSDNLSGSTKTFAGDYPRVDWYAELVSKPSDLTMKAGQMQRFTVTLKNRGAQSWTKDIFHLGLHNAGSNEAGSFFLTKAADGSDSGWLSDNRIHSNETTVGTDQTATFDFWMRAPATAGSYTEHLSLVNDGSGGFWFTDNSPHNNSAHNGPDIALNITVNPDTPPHLDDQSITVDQDSSVDISLHPTGGNGNPWIVQNSRPRHGTLSEGSDSLSALYTPDAGYVGQDSFTVRVADGLLTSNSATISITVEPAAAPPPAPDPQPTVNIPPEAQDQNLTARRNRSLAITLFGFDSDGDALTYQPIIVPRQLIRGRWVGGSPAHGTLTGSGANWTYTPDANFRGRDSFQFTVDDGEATSTGTINITVR